MLLEHSVTNANTKNKLGYFCFCLTFYYMMLVSTLTLTCMRINLV